MQKAEALLYPQKAVWDKREYKRHSVESIEHFCGWKALLGWVGAAKTQEEKDLIAFTFSTGGRISEVLQLKITMFRALKAAKPPILIVKGMPLYKRYKKVEEYRECIKCGAENPKALFTCEKCDANLLAYGKRRFKTKREIKYRNEFVVRLDEPLARQMVPTILRRIEEKQPFIFAKPSGKLRGRRWAYKVLRRIGEETGTYLYCHRLRAERACHLATALKAESLLEWFGWLDWSTAKRYAKKGALGLAEEMGVELPKGAKLS